MASQFMLASLVVELLDMPSLYSAKYVLLELLPITDIGAREGGGNNHLMVLSLS